MKLSTRLVLLVLGCLLPILTAQIYSQVNLYSARHEQLGALLLRQAELANSDMSSIVDGVHQLGTLVGQFPEVRSSGPECDERLTTLRRSLDPYRFLALFRPTDGTLICASALAPSGLANAAQSWGRELLTTQGLSIGVVSVDPVSHERFLPVAVHLPSVVTGGAPRVLLAALSVDWITKHLRAARPDHAPPMAHATLLITDRDGTVLASAPGSDAWSAPELPEWLRPLIIRDSAGMETIVAPGGRVYIAAYVPAMLEPTGLAVIELLMMPDLTTDIDQATYQDLMVIVGAALVALILAWVAGRRFIYQPTEALLQAARKWREGDLSARATLVDAGSEFSALSQSFNAMAAGLQAREMERRLQSSFLEAQVAERTQELSESNNRLQVEIAGREKTEAALHQAQKLQAVGQLAGGIAHDFNNMLATVLGNLELMERRVSQTTKEWTQADADRLLRLIERATGAVQRGGQLTSRLLTFSRRQRLAARATDINELLREVITLATSTLGRRIQVVPELASDLWPAMVDPSQVEAAILNLCLNARDAMPDGGRLTILTDNLMIGPDAMRRDGYRSELPPGGYVRICICDTGSGMSAEIQARAFDPFFTTKGPGGSGLGLSQVYGMARQSGGSVTLESTPGEGTRVTLCLPRTTSLAESDGPAGEPEETAMPGTPGELVLVVDDDHAVRQVTVEMVRDLGCEVVQAAGGEQALALMDKIATPPKLILLDYAMPGMNGLQLARALRERGLTAPIALVTGYAELSDVDVEASQLAGLLRKPFTIRELQGLLAQLRAAASGATATAQLEPGLIES